ncbi:MAG TPA: polynucleotide kinase-phosphatase, partial [Streptosporangiaceae bacterium]
MSAARWEIAIPELSLVALVGISGCGKSTFARRHFALTETLSSDACRGLVADNENDQAATKDAFDVLYYIAGKRLAAGRLTVVDATNVQADARKQLVAAAREHDMLPVAIVLDLPESLCVERNAQRQDRQFGRHVLRRQHDQLRRSMRSLKREGFRHVWVLSTQEEIDAAVVTRVPMLTDLRHETGPFDVIGDVHGCLDELAELLTLLGYQAGHDPAGHLTGASHPQGRKAVFLGDLVDRGPETPGVLRLVMGMTAAGDALAVAGNHEAKLVRALRGRDVKIGHGLAESLSQLAASDAAEPGFRDAAERFTDGLISHYMLDGGRLVVAHAGLKQAYHGRASGRVRAFALYGDTTGETDEFGLPVRYPWANDYRGQAMVLYGHTPIPEPEWVNNTMCLDTGCVFGGRLTALRYPERELVSVPARRTYYEPVKPLAAPLNPTTGDAPRREPDVLDIGDVLGKRIVHTRHHGRITIAEQNAAAALEVMSRFAVDPRWLLYLPPTMSPVATSQHPGLLEHPAQAFSAYRDAGADQVICEEKHMGSRCVAIVCDSAQTAADRFGLDDGSTGAVYTRTGRPFFDPELTGTLLHRLRGALTSAGVFGELSSGWVILDAELLPWSAKAGDLIRDQYAAVGAAARASLPAAISALEQAANTGRDVTALLDRARSRAANADAFTDAYRRYCWPVSGLDGIKLAPFQLLAAENATFHDRDHRWHLQLAGRLAAADPELITATRHVVITLDGSHRNPAEVALDGRLVSEAAGAEGGEVAGAGGEWAVAVRGEAEAVAWWEELTAGGGEGMVVKPLANYVRGPRGLVQPGLKVRGRDYLRIIYGPDYADP